MIKIAIKHWIYETCINVLFDNIFVNFMSVFPDNTIIPPDIMHIYMEGLDNIPNSKSVMQLGQIIATVRMYYSSANIKTIKIHDLEDLEYFAKKVAIELTLQYRGVRNISLRQGRNAI